MRSRLWSGQETRGQSIKPAIFFAQTLFFLFSPRIVLVLAWLTRSCVTPCDKVFVVPCDKRYHLSYERITAPFPSVHLQLSACQLPLSPLESVFTFHIGGHPSRPSHRRLLELHVISSHFCTFGFSRSAPLWPHLSALKTEIWRSPDEAAVDF